MNFENFSELIEKIYAEGREEFMATAIREYLLCEVECVSNRF